MARSPKVKSSEIIWDGMMPVVYNSGHLAFAAGAVSNQGEAIAPCDLTIKKIIIRVLTTTSNAGAKLNFGITTDSDKFLDSYVITDLAAGVYEIDGSALADATIDKGEAVMFELEAASAAGTLAATVVCFPRE